MPIMAHIQDGKVVNTSVWDGMSAYTPFEGVTLVRLSDKDEPEPGMPGIGWDYTDGEFIDNRPVEQFPV